MTEDDRELLGPLLYPRRKIDEMISQEFNTESKKFKKQLKQKVADVLLGKAVVAVTCQFSVSSATPVPDAKYKTIIIDEAAQAVEPDVVMPLTLQADDVQVVLIGDHKQLPATVKHRP